jgi:hypothetical protein
MTNKILIILSGTFITAVCFAAPITQIILRQPNGDFFAPLLPQKIVCDSIRDGILRQKLAIQSKPLQMTIIDPQREYSVFSGSTVASNSDCSGLVEKEDTHLKLQLSCSFILGSKTTKKDLFIELNASNGISIITTTGSTNISTKWSLENCVQ